MGKHAFVVVLGSISQSPRMQYHALSIATEGCPVTIIGYRGGQPLQKLVEHPLVKFKYIADCPEFKLYFVTILSYVLKALWQSVTLLLALILAGVPSVILVQNPPAIPSLAICWLYSLITRAKYVIDWHNYAYTILSLSLGMNHLLVRVCKEFEFFFGRRSNANLCVTRAMKEDLLEKGIKSETLYDRPPDHFRVITNVEKHELLRRVGKEYPNFIEDCNDNETVLTRESEDKSVALREDRPGLLVSSTSWTEDEDFTLLLNALQTYEERKSEGEEQLPKLLVVITGKGYLKEFYSNIIKRKMWQHIEVVMPWLSAEDYPKLLACGDLGVCLHTSSSGLDLPMKVVDMFGCGLPVAAVYFKCLAELVRDRENGIVFKTSKQLSHHLLEWFLNFPEAPPQDSWRSSLAEHINKVRKMQWHQNWLDNAAQFFEITILK